MLYHCCNGENLVGGDNHRENLVGGDNHNQVMDWLQCLTACIRGYRRCLAPDLGTNGPVCMCVQM
jgi:hypothetical protein